MNRLQAELQRLYGAGRVAVLEVAGAGGWAALARVWQGVQADLEWPAPGIAVNGSDACQLWFSFPEGTGAQEIAAWLASLRGRYLRELRPERVRSTQEPASMPPFQVADDRWSAFVTQDLAALFDEGPWLDLPPGADAQADLLSRLQVMAPEDLRRATQKLEPAASVDVPSTPGADQEDPRRFLLRVMNDEGVDMHLRIEAARALLASPGGQRP